MNLSAMTLLATDLLAINPSKEGLYTDDMLEEVEHLYEGADPAHDFSHVMRVYQNAAHIGKKEGADMQVLLLAALLHDAGAKSKRFKTESNQKGLEIAEDFLKKRGILKDVREKVLYAIDVHGFSKGIVPTTLEAKVLQDADRLDAMGAIGIARVFALGGILGKRMYHPEDPFCRAREPDDGRWNLDHFFKKLLLLESGMHTKTAKRLAEMRGAVLRRYLSDLKKEIEG